MVWCLINLSGEPGIAQSPLIEVIRVRLDFSELPPHLIADPQKTSLSLITWVVIIIFRPDKAVPCPDRLLVYLEFIAT
jgi:hypothetical protein